MLLLRIKDFLSMHALFVVEKRSFGEVCEPVVCKYTMYVYRFLCVARCVSVGFDATALFLLCRWMLPVREG